MVSKLGRAKKGRGKSPRTHKHRRSVPSIVNNIIEQADVILEILDARFIEKTRNLEMEKKVKRLGKTIIYVFNKLDLADVDKIKQDIELQELKPGIFFSARERKGSGGLRKLIKIEANKINEESVNIGVIGYPNTGKSSIINLLSGKSVAKTSSEAGYTKGIQKIKLSEGLYLIDTPGIIPPKEKMGGNKENYLRHAQIGAITWDRAKNPDMVVFGLMKEYQGVLEKYYKIDADGDSELLIEKLGRKLNYLKKGNLIDENRVSKKILKDWQEGKIRI